MKSPSAALCPHSQCDSVALPHTILWHFKQSSEHFHPPPLLLQSCSTSISSCWGSNNSSCKGLGITALKKKKKHFKLTYDIFSSNSSCYIEIPCLFKKKEMKGNKSEWLWKEWKRGSGKAREKMWLDKPMVQIPALPHTFSPRACTSSLLKSSKDLWNLEEHPIFWGALHSPPGSFCLPGHLPTWLPI